MLKETIFDNVKIKDLLTHTEHVHYRRLAQCAVEFLATQAH